MKQYIISVTALAVVLGLLQEVQSFPADQLKETETLWPIPQINGTVLWMTESDALEEVNRAEVKKRNESFDSVKFFLYTEETPTEPQEIIKGDPESLARSNFNFKNPTRVMIHGWYGDYTSGWSIREALLMNGTDRSYNFLAVDWSVYSKSAFYISSQRKCSKVGKIVAEFLDWLHDEAKLSFDNLAVYGSSLGAHIAGFTGKNVKRGKIQTIVGMDPAKPLFSNDHPEKRLADTDAVYVETIQTSGDFLGFYKPIGKAAFYPNGGKKQPGCEGDFLCSHIRSMDYFAEALIQGKRNSFFVIGCGNFESLQKGTCNKKARGVKLGDPNNVKKAKGIYYLLTNSHKPYSLVRIP